MAFRACDPLTEFDCSGGFREHCVPRDAVCDGTMDCVAGEDEDRVHCLPKNGEKFKKFIMIAHFWLPLRLNFLHLYYSFSYLILF